MAAESIFNKRALNYKYSHEENGEQKSRSKSYSGSYQACTAQKVDDFFAALKTLTTAAIHDIGYTDKFLVENQA